MNFPRGSSVGDTVDILIPIIDDDAVEGDEAFTVQLEPSRTRVVIGNNARSRITIIDDDVLNLGTVQLTQTDITVNENAGMADITITRTGGSEGAISVVFDTDAGSATRGSDYSNTTQTLSWDAGDRTDRVVSVPIVFDSVEEGSETFTVNLRDASPDQSVIGSPATATVTINNVFNQNPGILQFSNSVYSVNEDAGFVTVTVSRTQGMDGDISITYATAAGGATAGSDFESTTGVLSWANNETTPRTFQVPIISDEIIESSESFTVTLSNAQPLRNGPQIGTPSVATVTINNIDPPIVEPPEPELNPGLLQFAQAALSIDESAGTLTVNVLRVSGADGGVSVQYASSDGQAIAGSDYEPANGTLFWASGDTLPKSFTININSDTDIDPNETFSVTLQGGLPSSEIIGSPQVLVVSINDSTIPVIEPAGIVAFTQANYSVVESDALIALTVERTDGTNGAVSVNYQTVALTAIEDTDYTAVSGTLNWNNGDATSRTISVPVVADSLLETIEQFQLVLSDVSPANSSVQLGLATATVSIADSTSIGTIGIVSTEVTIAESAGVADIEVARINGTDGTVSVDYTLIEESATAGDDFTQVSGTLTWADGESGIRTISIAVLADELLEQAETLLVQLGNAQPTGDSQLGDTQAQVTISDSTEAPQVPPEIEPEVPQISEVPDDEPNLNRPDNLSLVIVSGDGQGGLPGDTLQPLVIDVIDTGANNALVPQVTIDWRAIPSGSAELLDGQQTVSTASGQSSMRVRILQRGFVRVVASIQTLPQPTPDNTTLAGLSTRIDPPDFAAISGEVVFTVRSGFLAADGLRDNPSATGGALDVICEVLGARLTDNQMLTPEQQDLFATCQELEARLQNDALGIALDRLTPEELFFIADSIIDTSDIQVTNVYARINAIRAGQAARLDLQGLSFSIYDQSIPGSVVNAAQNQLSGGGASADGSDSQLDSRLGVFANGAVSIGEIEAGGNQHGADFHTSGITLGLDYRFSDNAVAGAGLGIVRNNTEFTADDGTADLNGLSLTLFATWYQPDKGYIDGVLEIGRNDYNIRRRINLPDTDDQFALGTTAANVLSFTLGAGRDWSRNGYEFGPYARLTHVMADVDAYAESASNELVGFGSVLNIQSHSVSSTTVSVGGQVSRTVNTRRGVFIPQLRLEAEFETEDRKEGIDASFQHDPTQSTFTVNGNVRDTSYINVGLGTSALFPNGKSGYLFYETQTQHDFVIQHWLKLGLRFEF